MANNENYTYANLITKVIENFDEIYSVLKSKGSVYNSAVLPTPAGTNMDTGIATDEYANILNDNLVKVNGLLVDDLSLEGGIMRNFKDLDISVNSGSSIDYNSKTLTLAKGSLGAAGYYDGNKVIIGITDKLSSATITNFATPTEDNKKYVLTPTNTIISSVTIDQGSVVGEVELKASDVTGDIPKAEVTVDLTQSQTIASTDAIANGIKLTFTTTPVLSGKINTVVKSKDITEGYIKAEDVTITGGQYDIKDVTVQGATSEYWISKGSVGIDADESSVSHDLVSDQVLFGSSTSDGYAIASKVDSVTVVPTVTAGYVTSDADTDFSADLKPADVVKYIKKGSVVGKEQKTATVGVVDGSNITTTSNDADNYVITVSTQDTVVEHTVTEGYIKPEDTTQVPNITVSGDSKTIKIAKGSAVVSSAVTESNIQVTAGSDYLSSTGKAITITATPTNSKGTFKAGYFESNAQITNTTATAGSRTFNITEGSVSLNNPTISCTAKNFTDTNSTVTNQIFKTSAPQNGEYYEIDAAVTGTVTPGWIDDADLNKSATAKYYVPKATFNFVKSDKGDANEFIQVTTGGYIPSGAIVELGSELSEADYAVVELNASDAESGIIMTSSAAEGDYSITVSKGTVNAGYISDAKGAVTEHVINIKHGSVETTADVNTNITADSLTIATEASDGKYAVGFNVGGTVKTTISEGYVKVADLEVNGEESKNNTSVEFNKNYSIDLNAGAVSISTEGISGSVAAGGGVEFADSSAYYVEPTISGNGAGGAATLNVSVATPGYIGRDYSASANVTLGQSSDIRKYIKQGTALTSVAGSGEVSITNNFNENNVDEYTISLTNPNATTIGVSGTLQTGYYGENEKNVSGSATVTGLTGTTKIARGKVQPTSVSTSISYEGLTDGITTTAPTGSNYIHLTASEGAATITRTVTAGYVKDNATDAPTNVANVTVSGTELYVRTYTNSNVTTAGNYLGGNVGEMTEAEASVSSWVENGAAVELESDKIVIDTAHKYSEKNIEVTLDADAAGKNVRSELYRLQQRLAGANATIRSLV